MTTSSYMPNDDGGKADLLDHLAATLPKYAALLEISDADIAILQADAASFRYALHTMNEMQLFSCRHAARGDKKIEWQDLWIVAASHVVDPTTWKPSLSIQIKAAHPVILWTKGTASAIDSGLIGMTAMVLSP